MFSADSTLLAISSIEVCVVLSMGMRSRFFRIRKNSYYFRWRKF